MQNENFMAQCGLPVACVVYVFGGTKRQNDHGSDAKEGKKMDAEIIY
jgi:hypothetical protein